jgi:hypothetical protein
MRRWAARGNHIPKPSSRHRRPLVVGVARCCFAEAGKGHLGEVIVEPAEVLEPAEAEGFVGFAFAPPEVLGDELYALALAFSTKEIASRDVIRRRYCGRMPVNVSSPSS